MNDQTCATAIAGRRGEYQPAGWMQWPDNPDYSFQFMRVLGAAQEGASTISECFQAGTRISPGDDESWHKEWTALGHRNKARAEAALAIGHVQTARDNWLRAANYFRSAEFFLRHDDPRRLQLLDLIEGCSREYMRRMDPAGEVVRVPYENGAHLDAYFLRAPYSLDRHPVVICFGGLDEFKDELLHEITRHAFARGLSLLLVDLPGQGGTLRRQKLRSRFDTEVPVGACVDYLESRADVDPDRIALYGASLGGYYAPRAASFEHRLKAVVSDGVIWNAQRCVGVPANNPSRIAVRHLHWILGVPGEGTLEGFDAVLEKLADFSLEGVQDKIRCPYLMVEGELDHAGFHLAEEAYAYSKAAGQDVTMKVFTAEETGASHCQIDNLTLGMEYICDWLADKLGIDQAALPGLLLKPNR
ncbi:alpha/beta hydrolase [Sphingomonas sp. CL5.1]|uniref:alpha/beta hydrolase family protein n=1 Tax=Sphingomonas sp. CL5.1 TaxID=2653203 RepID=UPI001581C1D8|nr:alpha/beta fold hydrolase [Sphingomonas sp. CL5.1]QKR99889.1 alpha/beta hydrolase [Sphingomonas sp. CL5.1]